MKKHLKTLAIALAMLGSFVLGANASSTQKQITAYLDYGATVSLNGVPQSFLDAKGDRVYVVRYGGTTYLPVRSMGNLFGLTVGYDAASNTVQLNQPTGVDLIDDIGAYYFFGDGQIGGEEIKSSANKKMTISGLDCTHWLNLWQSHRIPAGRTARASFNLEGKYESLTFKCYSESNAIVRVLADGAVQKEIEIQAGNVAKEYTVPVFGAEQLTIEADNQTNYAACNTYIFNATVKPIALGQ